MAETVLGILGGSGLYGIDALEDTRWEQIQTPFGAPSDALLFGRLGGTQLVFLPRHGRGHVHSPTTVPYRANIWALKQAGVTELLSLSAVGSLKEELPPGHFVLVDQFIDRSFARPKTFFERGMVAHVSMADPVCGRLGDALQAALEAIGQPHTRGGCYLAMEGPQFSTRAESELYRSWGASVIGMTNMPEAKLAREAELCYATVAMVTDYDCWRPDTAAVEVRSVLEVLRANTQQARRLLSQLAPALSARPEACPCGCDRALEHALITDPKRRDRDQLERLAPLLARTLAKEV